MEEEEGEESAETKDNKRQNKGREKGGKYKMNKKADNHKKGLSVIHSDKSRARDVHWLK